MSQYSQLELQYYSQCQLCPRACGVNRIKGETGFCKMGPLPMVARAALHFWEEPCISKDKGSGTVFFSGCNLGCVFCQNHKISQGTAGAFIDKRRLSEIFLELQDQNANNINLVTGVMFIPTIAEAINMARNKGLKIPIVYNSGGYESPEALKLLDGLVDIYLPDCKYQSEDLARQYSKAPDYYIHAKKAIEEMWRQTQGPIIDEKGLMKKGVIIRHLVLPGQRKEAERILEDLYCQYGDKVYFSILNQYTPVKGMSYPDQNLQRKLTTYEYEKVIDYALSIGITQGYMQQRETATESFIPSFDLEGVLKKNEQDK